MTESEDVIVRNYYVVGERQVAALCVYVITHLVETRASFAFGAEGDVKRREPPQGEGGNAGQRLSGREDRRGSRTLAARRNLQEEDRTGRLSAVDRRSDGRPRSGEARRGAAS